MPTANNPQIDIQFRHSQVGCAVFARTAKTWRMVELLEYGKYLDTQRTEREYLDLLDSRNVNYRVVPHLFPHEERRQP